MPPPSKSIRPSHHGAAKESGGDPEAPPSSNNLWIGNLSADVTDADLMDVFGKYGALDATSYASRSFAFVFFKRPDDAAAAKEALQGTSVKGNPIKIEFARPAKPCKQLWVGGINPAVSKEELEEEFGKFGKFDDFKLFRDRNTALLEYVRVEDAIQAMRNMNGKQLGGDQIRVDFLRSQPSRREHWADAHDSREFIGRGMGPTDVHAGSKRQQLSHSSGSRRGDGQPSKVLWIGYPPSVQIDEQMLHNAMILFGEIERIKSFPSRHYSFVEFRSVDEARRAKEGLQGRLFNDPRITIMFSSSDLAPGREIAFHQGVRGARTEMEQSFRTAQMDMFGHNHHVGAGSLPHGVGQNITVRAFGASEYDDDVPYGMQDVNAKNLMGSSWRRSSPPSSGLLPSPVSGVRTPVRATGSWDVYDASHFPRDSKRSRIESSLPPDEASFPLRKIDDRGLRMDHGHGSAIDGGSGPFANSHGNGRLSPMGARFASGPAEGPDDDYIWRGLIAKGGTPVCRARCVPVGEGLAAEIPEVVNCSARTSLDLLATHYKEAFGFDIVFFLPDSEEEFGSYTEFLRYLGSKDRAGVAKLDDGTTLFLVPPSEFLRKVLRVTGPERLYGVVLKFAQVPGMQHQPHESLPLSQFADAQRMPAFQPEYGYPSPTQEVRNTPEDAKLQQQLLYAHMGESSAMRSVTHEQVHSNAATASQAGVALTPELIATLASLIPASTRTSSAESSQQNLRPMFPSVVPNNEPSVQAWKQEHQASDSGGYSVQQPGSQLNPPLSSVSQFQPYTSVPSIASQSMQVPAILPSTHMQESVLNPSQYAAVSRSFTNIPSQGGQFAASVQQFPVEVPPSSSGLYSSPLLQQHSSSGLASQVQGPSFSQLQTVVPTTYADVSNQPQQIQSSASGAAQGIQDEVDKNQRYQSTLQFAASLLQQIQQQQQQQQQPTTSAHNGQGYGAGN